MTIKTASLRTTLQQMEPANFKQMARRLLGDDLAAGAADPVSEVLGYCRAYRLNAADLRSRFPGLLSAQRQAAPAATDKTPARLAAESHARRLGFTAMESRDNDSLDFKEVSIVGLLRELEAAYLAGYNAGLSR